MNDFTLYSNADESKRNLTFKFVTTGSIAALLIVVVITISGYHMVRTSAIEATLDRTLHQLQADTFQALQASSLAVNDATTAQQLGSEILRQIAIKQVALFDRTQNKIWTSTGRLQINLDERDDFTDVLAGGSGGVVLGNTVVTADAWKQLINDEPSTVEALATITNRGGESVGVAKLIIDITSDLRDAKSYGVKLFLLALLGCALLSVVLYFNFRRGVQTIAEQEAKLNNQISSLSDLLAINKKMQKNMKTASARAVELNEQFLRRVGADLHDGPAQMIGFAVLRLNKVSQMEVAKQLGQEFHAVKEALDQSLDEIRGISSGLVLPELETMTLEQCLRKVVLLHGVKSDAEVAQYYQGLPEALPLPIKICAYRFVQEGLNNAHRHGQAQKCRLSAHVMDDVLHLSLKDNGMGFRKSQLSTNGGHLGLMGLKDRIESLGGNFSINSELGVGTALKMSVRFADDTD